MGKECHHPCVHSTASANQREEEGPEWNHRGTLGGSEGKEEQRNRPHFADWSRTVDSHFSNSFFGNELGQERGRKGWMKGAVLEDSPPVPYCALSIAHLQLTPVLTGCLLCTSFPPF